MPYKTVTRTTPCGGKYTEKVYVPERKKAGVVPPAKVVEKEIKRIKRERQKEATPEPVIPA